MYGTIPKGSAKYKRFKQEKMVVAIFISMCQLLTYPMIRLTAGGKDELGFT